MIETFKAVAEMKPLYPKPVPGSRFRSLLIILNGVILGAMVAYLISLGYWLVAAAAIILVPLTIWLSTRPFSGVILWLLVMPFVSALPSPDLAYWAVYRILPPIILCQIIFLRILKTREYPPARFGPPELAMIVLVLIVPTTTLLFQSDPELALIRFADRMILPFCMYLIIRLGAPREREFNQLQWAALFIVFTQSVIGFLSWYAPQILPHPWHYLNGERTTGSLKDPDLYAAMLMFSATLLMHAAVNHKSRLMRLIFFLAIGLCAVFTFLSLERAAWLGGIAVTIGLVILYPKTMLRLLIVGAIGVVILGTGMLSTHFALSADRFSESSPVYDRVVIFDAMAQMIALKPVLGWGYETLDQNIQHFYRRVGEATVSRIVTSHNTYMTVLTELGLVGAILYLFPVAWWFVLSIRVWRRIPKDGGWSRPLLGVFWLALLFQFIISNFFDMRWFPIGLTLWWLTLGLIANMVYPYLKGRSIPQAIQVESDKNNG